MLKHHKICSTLYRKINLFYLSHPIYFYCRVGMWRIIGDVCRAQILLEFGCVAQVWQNWIVIWLQGRASKNSALHGKFYGIFHATKSIHHERAVIGQLYSIRFKITSNTSKSGDFRLEPLKFKKNLDMKQLCNKKLTT